MKQLAPFKIKFKKATKDMTDKTKHYTFTTPEFHLSYNGCIGDNIFDRVLVKLGEAKDRIGKDETALHDEVTDMWYILNGDFRKQYEACTSFKQLMDVYTYYRPKYRSDFSTD